MFPELTDDEVDYVIAKVIEWDKTQCIMSISNSRLLAELATARTLSVAHILASSP